MGLVGGWLHVDTLLVDGFLIRFLAELEASVLEIQRVVLKGFDFFPLPRWQYLASVRLLLGLLVNPSWALDKAKPSVSTRTSETSAFVVQEQTEMSGDNICQRIVLCQKSRGVEVIINVIINCVRTRQERAEWALSLQSLPQCSLAET